MNKRWNEFCEEFIRQNAHKYTDKEGAAKLTELTGVKFTLCGWRKRRQLLGVKKASGRGVCRVVSGAPEGKGA